MRIGNKFFRREEIDSGECWRMEDASGRPLCYIEFDNCLLTCRNYDENGPIFYQQRIAIHWLDGRNFQEIVEKYDAYIKSGRYFQDDAIAYQRQVSCIPVIGW